MKHTNYTKIRVYSGISLFKSHIRLADAVCVIPGTVSIRQYHRHLQIKNLDFIAVSNFAGLVTLVADAARSGSDQ